MESKKTNLLFFHFWGKEGERGEKEKKYNSNLILRYPRINTNAKKNYEHRGGGGGKKKEKRKAVCICILLYY